MSMQIFSVEDNLRRVHEPLMSFIIVMRSTCPTYTFYVRVGGVEWAMNGPVTSFSFLRSQLLGLSLLVSQETL